MILWFQIFKIFLHHTDGVVVQDNNDTYLSTMPMYAQGKMMFLVEFVAMKARQTH
jgi:hypothetical protein